MRRLSVLLMLTFALTLSACGVYTDHRDIDGLRIIESMGIDYLPGGVKLSFALAAAEENVLRLSAAGSSVSAALERARNAATQGELFFPHINNIIVGSQSAESGLEPVIEFICRSPVIRTDTDVFIADGKGSDAVLETGDENAGIAEAVSRLHAAAENGRAAHICTAAEIINRSEKYGSALVSRLKLTDAAEEGAKTVIPDGYTILSDYKAVGNIRPELTFAAALLENKPYLTELQLPSAAVQLEGGSSDMSAVYENGLLTEIVIRAEVTASIIELEDDADRDKVRKELEQRILREVMSIIELSKNSSADFLGIAGKVGAEDIREALPSLRFTVSVSGSIAHGNDINEA